MGIVQLNLQMHEVVCFVLCMKLNMEQNAAWLAVWLKKSLEHRHVRNIKQIGPDSRPVLLAKRCPDFEECFGDLAKHYHGSLLQYQIPTAMMRICLKWYTQIISLPAVSIV